MDIIGAVSFSALLVSLFILLLILRRRSTIDEIKGLFLGLIIIIYTSISGLNITSILFTFTAFVGMGMGCSKK
jgi:hypothetical protein